MGDLINSGIKIGAEIANYSRKAAPWPVRRKEGEVKIGIPGSGRTGAGPGHIWAASGHAVNFAHSRDPDRLERLARQCGALHGRRGGGAGRGASAGRALVAHRGRSGAGGRGGRKVALNGGALLDATDSDLVVGTTTSGAGDQARMRPEARWVSCFDTSPSESFEAVFARTGRSSAPRLLVSGDDDVAKTLAGTLVRDIGFERLEDGALRYDRFIDPFAMVTAEPAHAQPGGPALTRRLEKLRS